MKTLLSAAIMCLSILGYGQSTVLKITVDKEHSTCFDTKTYSKSKYKKSIDSAFVIMNAVLNSPDFLAIIGKNDFPCENRCCISCAQHQNAINAREITDSLFKELAVVMTINLKKSCRSKLGSTNHKEYYTTACLENIKVDMPKLPLAYAIAVNLCHEYMHHIGFYHSDFDMRDRDKETPNPDGYKNDIAYRVGWDVYTLLKKWHEGSVKIEGL